jgi:N-acetylmuramoyl-L-alanine amidase
LLSQASIRVDLIPATVPADYRADAFIAIHADANADKSLSGDKAARATNSAIPLNDDALLSVVSNSYQAVTGLSWHAKTITQNMLEYYAFDQRMSHSVDPSTPSIILEMGFLTNANDNRLLTTQPDVLAQAVALGILSFLAK